MNACEKSGLVAQVGISASTRLRIDTATTHGGHRDLSRPSTVGSAVSFVEKSKNSPTHLLTQAARNQLFSCSPLLGISGANNATVQGSIRESWRVWVGGRVRKCMPPLSSLFLPSIQPARPFAAHPNRMGSFFFLPRRATRCGCWCWEGPGVGGSPVCLLSLVCLVVDCLLVSPFSFHFLYGSLGKHAACLSPASGRPCTCGAVTGRRASSKVRYRR